MHTDNSHDILYTNIDNPAVQELLSVLWIYSAHLREILQSPKFRHNPSLVSSLHYELANLYRKSWCKNSDFIWHLQMTGEYYDPESSHYTRCNAWNYLWSSMPKYIEREPPLEITNGKMNIGDHVLQIKWQLLPRIKTLSLSKYVIENLLTPNTTLIDIWTWTWAIPLFISQQDKEKKLDMALGYDLKYTIEIHWHDFEQQPYWISTRAEIEKDLIQRDILPNKHIIITANLPYGTQQDYKNYPDRVKKEPLPALLWWGKDGLDTYREYIIWLSKSEFLQNISWIVFEWWSKNISQLFNLCKDYFPWFSVELLPDCFGKERFVQMKSKIKDDLK
ncbi:MAG: hypothetical protein ACD_80C00164G0004 [uncultured bacterium (gcode 4)]|uniref:Uncharacterized protein n=1 Tax=uncultured bacterium (gcode 4) TaxID=1234023 RepID=K1XHN9_9BACT|nr:MAG: hypothetical protein ACD_80C00164G0004 [uncultured bacterium (gcode 4)]